MRTVSSHSAHRPVALAAAREDIWSYRHSLWREFRVAKPRLPLPQDDASASDWSALSRPVWLTSFVGSQNNDLFKHLRGLREDFELRRELPPMTLLCGGTGKSAILHALQCELLQLCPNSNSNKWLMAVDVKDYLKDLSALLERISLFVSKDLARLKLSLSFRLLLVDNVDALAASDQQSLRKLLESLQGSARYVLTASEQTRVIEPLLLLASVHRIHPLEEKDALGIVLRFCRLHSIGFEREGLQEIFAHCSAGGSRTLYLNKVFQLMQAVFVKTQFVSAENVRRVTTKDGKKRVVDVSQPRDRCRICTLFPPCKHISPQEVCASNRLHLQTLPTNGAIVNCPLCIDFRNRGYCAAFDLRGYCRFSHPKNSYELIPPLERCAQCTLPWLCNHCAFNKGRKKLASLLQDVSKRQLRARILLSVEPSADLLAPLVPSSLPPVMKVILDLTEIKLLCIADGNLPSLSQRY